MKLHTKKKKRKKEYSNIQEGQCLSKLALSLSPSLNLAPAREEDFPIQIKRCASGARVCARGALDGEGPSRRH